MCNLIPRLSVPTNRVGCHLIACANRQQMLRMMPWSQHRASWSSHDDGWKSSSAQNWCWKHGWMGKLKGVGQHMSSSCGWLRHLRQQQDTQNCARTVGSWRYVPLGTYVVQLSEKKTVMETKAFVSWYLHRFGIRIGVRTNPLLQIISPELGALDTAKHSK